MPVSKNETRRSHALFWAVRHWTMVAVGHVILALVYAELSQDDAASILFVDVIGFAAALSGMDRDTQGARWRLHGAAVAIAAMAMLVIPTVYHVAPFRPWASGMAATGGLALFGWTMIGNDESLRRRIATVRFDLAAVWGYAMACPAAILFDAVTGR